jgi:predicted ATPase
MTYWHMQLHPDAQNWGKEKEVLEKLSIIGLGGDEDSLKVVQFQREMRVGDIVLVKRGGNPIALVEITGDCEYDEDKVDWDFDWFYYRRTVKVLAFADDYENLGQFPLPRGTLKKSINSSTHTYKYIQKWHFDVISKNASDEVPSNLIKNKGVKIREMYISKSKALRDFNVSFLDENGNPRQVIVIAGINGSGKTTLFEYLNSFVTVQNFDEDDFVKLNNNDDILEIYKDSSRGKTKGINDLKRNLYYLPVFDGNLDKLSKKIVTHIDKVVFEDGVSSALAYKELQETVNDIFAGFDLQIFFSGLNRDKNILFKNKNGDVFSLKDLSTGEKVLLSKSLYLHLENDITDSVILIDEPEMSLHPKWQSMIFSVYEKLAREKNNQIIIATHSPQIIANTPYQNLIILHKQDSKIVPLYPNHPPAGVDANSILAEVMGVEQVLPQDVEDLHRQYRKLVEDKQENSPEADEVKQKLLQRESNDSKFMQEMRFLMRLRGNK